MPVRAFTDWQLLLNTAQVREHYCRRAFFLPVSDLPLREGYDNSQTEKNLHLDQEVHLELAPGKTLLETEKVKSRGPYFRR